MLITNQTKKSTTTTTYEHDECGDLVKEVTEKVIEEPLIYPEESTTACTVCEGNVIAEGTLLESKASAFEPLCAFLCGIILGGVAMHKLLRKG